MITILQFACRHIKFRIYKRIWNNNIFYDIYIADKLFA